MDQSTARTLKTQQAAIKDQPFSPDMVIHAITGCSSFKLEGFQTPAQALPFWIPSITRPEPADVLAIDEARKLSRRIRMRWLIAALAAILATTCLLGAWAGARWMSPQTSAQITPWRIVKVETTGVQLRLGDSLVFVAVGGILPNAEPLLATNVAKKTYTTPSQIAVVLP